MMPVLKKRLTSIVKTCMIVGHQRAFEIPIYWGQRAREARQRGQNLITMVERLDDGEAF